MRPSLDVLRRERHADLRLQRRSEVRVGHRHLLRERDDGAVDLWH